MPSKEQTSKVHKLFLYIGIGYVFIVILYLLFRNQLETFLAVQYSKDFAVGFSSALAENLFFYLFGLPIAYASIVLSMIDPKDGSFETRVKALTNSDKIFVDDELYEYLKVHFTTFLAFAKKNTITIELRDYNEENKAYYIYAKTNFIIANMCKDNDFESTDARSRVIPDVQVNGEWGAVIRLETYSTQNGQSIDTAYSYHKIDSSFDEKIKLDIPKNEEIGFVFEYILWSKTGADKTINTLWYFFQTQRYTRSVEISVANRLTNGKSLIFDARCFKNKIKAVNLQQDDKQGYIPLETDFELQHNVKKDVIYKSDLYPGDRIEFFFYEPHENKGGQNENIEETKWRGWWRWIRRQPS